MGRDGLYELLGAVWLSEGEEYREKLVREALKRGSGEERQRYNLIQQRKAAVFQRLQQYTLAQSALSSRDTQNLVPQAPSSSPAPERNPKTLGLPRPDSAGSRRKEADSDAKRQQYTAALIGYRVQDSAVLSERLKLMGEFQALQLEIAALEEEEKWLLLAMAIKNQSSLMGYMQQDSSGK